MSQAKLEFVCGECGQLFPRWMGKCSACHAWNTLEPIATETAATDSAKAPPVQLQSFHLLPEIYLPSGIPELDHVLGKGFVNQSVVLLGGEPGIGKSTICLQICKSVAKSGKKVLYVSAEESLNQLYLRANRISAEGEAQPESLFVLAEGNLAHILETIREIQPSLVVLDSIQVVHHPRVPSTAGTVNQVRACAAEFIQAIKTMDSVGIIVGHITKDGNLAGPKVLEHLVDTILYFEGERNQKYRMLRSFKNRFYHTNEIGIFDMTEVGLVGVTHPSELFIDETTLKHPGSMVIPVMEGHRAMLVELQALVVDSGYGMAKRTFLGVDPNRANLLLAAVEKQTRLGLATKDIFITIIGGISIREPALDLGLILAVFASIKNIPLSKKIGVLGEVGLTGEVRVVTHVEDRLIELSKMGFTHAILPKKNQANVPKDSQVVPIFVENIEEAVRGLLSING